MIRWIPFDQQKPGFDCQFEVITTYGHQMVLLWRSCHWVEELSFSDNPKSTYHQPAYYPVAFWRSKPEGDK